MKKHIFTAIKLIFFIGLGIFITWLFLHNLQPEDKKKILDSYKDVKWGWIIIVAIIGLLSHYFRTVRWNMLLEAMGYKTSFLNSFMAVMIGYFANMALPRLGEVIRCSILNKYDKIPINKSFGTVVVERALDILVFLILFFFTILFQFHLLKDYAYNRIYIPLSNKFGAISLYHALYILLIICVLIVFFIFILRKRIAHLKIYIKIAEIIKGFWHGLKSIAHVKNSYLFVFHSLMIWACYLSAAYVGFFVMKGTTGLGFNAALASLSFGTISYMVIQGGIGVYPIIISETLSLYSVDKAIGFGFGWLLWSLQSIEIIIGGLISLIILPIKNSKPDAVKE